MTPEDFEALLRIAPDELVDEYYNIVNMEYYNRRQKEAGSTPAGSFNNAQWSSAMLNSYMQNSINHALAQQQSNLTAQNPPKKKFWPF